MEANNNSKTREVLNRVHEFLSNLCRDARCDDHCSECLGASDLADDVYDLLHTPPRNSEVGTPEEQAKRFDSFCVSHYTPPSKDGVVPDGCDCPCYTRGKGCNPFVWEQLPYVEKEGGAE